MRTPAAGGLLGAIGAFERRLLPRLQQLQDEPHIAAVRAAIQPAFYALGGATILAYFFVKPQPLMSQIFDAYHVGFGVMGIVLAGSLADRLARAFGFNRTSSVIVTLACFILSMPLPIPRNPVAALGQLASSSLFLALIVGFVTGEIFRAASRRIANTYGRVIAAGAASLLLFGGLAALLLPTHHSMADVLLLYFIKPLVSVGDTLPILLLVVFLQTLLWSVGIHGPAFLSAVTLPIFLSAIDQNGQAARLGQVPPYIVTLSFFTFVYPGGSGATLPLSFLMLRSKLPRLRKLGIATIVPSIFNVNEPLIFGVPLVMNPTLAIPFVATPLALAVLSYIATWFGLVDKTVLFLPGAGIPSPINAYLITGRDWRAVILVGVNIAVAFALYWPFFRSFEATLRRAPGAEEQLVKTAEQIREHQLEHLESESAAARSDGSA